jgi:hypothetical protein
VAVGLALALLWLGLRSRDAQPSTAQRVASAKPQPVPPAPAPVGSPPAAPATPAAPAASPATPAPGARARSKIRTDYESEPRDAGGAAAEARIREIFAAQPGAEGVLHEVQCTATVCKIDARWSRDLNRPYNAALLGVIKEFSKEMSFEPGGAPEGSIMPMAIYVRRPGHAAQSPATPPNPVTTPAPAAQP